MSDCPGCNPTPEELNAITGVVFTDVYDQAFEICLAAFGWTQTLPEGEVAENPAFILMMKTVMDRLLPQAIHSRLHSSGPIAGHGASLS